MMAASISITLAEVNTAPRPALKSGSSSRRHHGRVTASRAGQPLDNTAPRSQRGVRASVISVNHSLVHGGGGHDAGAAMDGKRRFNRCHGHF